MVNFFKKKFNNLAIKKKGRPMRELPASCARKRIVVGKKKIRINCKSNGIYIKVAAWCFGFIFIGMTFYALFLSPLLSISVIDVSGEDSLSRGAVNDSVLSSMSGKVGRIFDADNLILSDTGNMEKNLLDRYKLIKTVSITKEFPNRLAVRLQERKSMLIYCVGGGCFVIDEDGRAYAKADFDKGELGENGLIVLNDDSGKKISPDTFYMDLDFIQFVLDAKSQLESGDIRIKNMFSTPVLISDDLHIETEDGWKIYFNRQLGIKSGVEMLKAVLKNSIHAEQINDLEYVDVRLADKVYYKLKTDENIDTGDGSPADAQSALELVPKDDANLSDKKKKK